MKSYDSISSFISGSVWAILPAKMDAMLDVIDARSAGISVDAKTAEMMAAANRRAIAPRTHRSVGVLPVYGILSQRMNLMSAMSGGTSTELLGRDFDALMADESVESIILDIDSPGGNYYGTMEIAEKIHAARGSKPIVAVANSMAASAAYWIGTAADELVVTPSGDVGSVGVLAVHEDHSRANEKAGIKPSYITYGQNKAEANPDGPLSDEATDHLQQSVNRAGETFVRSVAKHRGIDPATVHQAFGQGRCYGAVGAVRRGMADRIGTLESEIDRLANAKQRARGRRTIATQRRRLSILSQ